MRRLNFTGRRKIKKSDVLITLYSAEDQDEVSFEVVLDLSSFTRTGMLPGESTIILEAYKGPRNERFDLGTVGAQTGHVRRKLTSFGKDEGVLFTVKVVDSGSDSGDPGRILALASAIRPVGPSEAPHTSLLPVTIESIGDLVFRVDFDDHRRPVLVLSKAIDSLLPEGIKAYAKSPVFMALVLPDVVRQVLTRILVIDGDAGDEEDAEDDSPPAQWKRFARSLNPEPIPSEGGPDTMLDWIDVAASESARRLDAGRKFLNFFTEQRS